MYINTEPSDPAAGKMNLVGVTDVKTHLPNFSEVPTITVKFICKFIYAAKRPYAPDCYKSMAEALLAVGLACGDVAAFEDEAREMVAHLVDAELKDALNEHFEMMERW